MVEGEGDGHERSGLHFSDIVLAVAVLSAADFPIKQSVLLGIIRL